LSQIKIIKTLKNINYFLLFIVSLIFVYILFLFFSPEASLALTKYTDETDGYIYKTKLAIENNIDENYLRDLPEDNRLVIPKIRVNSTIWEGDSKDILNSGVWRRPNTSKPDLGSNTVLTAHRFLTKFGSNTFYHLDKIENGDKIIVIWEKEEFIYEVSEIKEVDPYQTQVENPTKEDILTLYTCSPLFSAEKRLVVRAVKINE